LIWRAGEGGTDQIGLLKRGVGQILAGEVAIGKVEEKEAGSREVVGLIAGGGVELRERDADRVEEIITSEISAADISAGKVSPSEVRAAKIGVGQICLMEIGVGSRRRKSVEHWRDWLGSDWRWQE